MALGGISLFLVCFLGFAAMGGVPVHEVAVIGKFFPAPPEDAPRPLDESQAPPIPQFESDEEVLSASMGVLHTWKLDAPFTGEELKSLADELKLKNTQLEQRLRDATEREQALDEREESLADQFETLDEMRAKLEAFEQELLLRAEEVERDESNAEAAKERRWGSLAKLFAEQEPEEAGRRLSAYSPADATKILLNLDESLALEILNTFTGDRFIEYAEAYAAAAPAQ